MKNQLGRIFGTLILFAFSSYSLAATTQWGVVDVNQLFNSSTYVQKANKELQDNVKKMDAELKDQQQKLQVLIDRYQKNQKPALLEQVKEKQASLAKMTQEYQQKVQAEQSSGMKQFSDYVRVAVAKVAKDKNLATVINSTAVVYTDSVQLMDITKDVAAEMDKEKGKK